MVKGHWKLEETWILGLKIANTEQMNLKVIKNVSVVFVINFILLPFVYQEVTHASSFLRFKKKSPILTEEEKKAEEICNNPTMSFLSACIKQTCSEMEGGCKSFRSWEKDQSNHQNSLSLAELNFLKVQKGCWDGIYKFFDAKNRLYDNLKLKDFDKFSEVLNLNVSDACDRFYRYEDVLPDVELETIEAWKIGYQIAFDQYRRYCFKKFMNIH